jgi:hypothetical protein
VSDERFKRFIVSILTLGYIVTFCNFLMLLAIVRSLGILDR